MLEKADVARAVLQTQKSHHHNCQVYFFILCPDGICQEIGYKLRKINSAGWRCRAELAESQHSPITG